MPQAIGSVTLRKNLSRILNETETQGERFIVKRGRKSIAALVPVEDLEVWQRSREERFSVLDRIHARMPDLPEEEVAADVAAAIAEVRSTRRKQRAQ